MSSMEVERLRRHVLMLRSLVARLPLTEAQASPLLQEWYDEYKEVMEETEPPGGDGEPHATALHQAAREVLKWSWCGHEPFDDCCTHCRLALLTGFDPKAAKHVDREQDTYFTEAEQDLRWSISMVRQEIDRMEAIMGRVGP